MESLLNNITPVFVEVTASESSSFQKDFPYPFTEFEALALSVALTNPVGDYNKTYVRVHFSNQDTYECRLDLGCGGYDQGFAERCLNHKLKGVEGIYDQYDYLDERKEALDKLATKIHSIVI